MDGMTPRQISLEKKVTTGEISNIINACRQGNPDLDEPRKLHLALGEAKTVESVRCVLSECEKCAYSSSGS
jgi:hypothetical protein